MKKELAKNTFIIAIGKICTQLVSFLLLPLYTGLLSTSEYGIVDLVSVLVMLVVPLVTLQIEQGVFRELIEVRNNKEKQINIISSTLFSVTIQTSIFVIIFFIISIFLKNNYKYFLLINTIGYIYNAIFLQIVRGLGFNSKYSLGSFLCASFTILFNVVFLVVFKLGATGMLLGNFFGYFISSVYLVFSSNLLQLFKPKFVSKNIIKKMLKYSVLLIPNAICWWIFGASDKIIVTAFLGVSAVGVLSASLKFSNLIASAYSVFHISWVESISINIRKDNGNSFFNEMLNLIFFVFASVSLVTISLMPFIFDLLINSSYSNGYNFIPISIVGALFNIFVSLITAVYYGYKDSKSIAQTSVMAALLNVIIHLILVKYIGLYAAPISTMIAYLVVLLTRTYAVNCKYQKIKLDKPRTLFTIMIFVLTIVFYYLDIFYLNILNILLTMIYVLFVNQPALKLVLKVIKNGKNGEYEQ